MAQDARLYLYFTVVAEELSFTAAAARLNVAQPWLSARIRQLEARLGTPLFVRTTRRVELTDHGAALLPRARAVTDAIGALESLARELRGAPAPLRLGAPPYLGQIPAGRRLVDAFRARYPLVPVELDVGWSRRLVPRLRAGELEAAFTLAAESDPELAELVLDDLRLELDMSATDLLAHGPLRPAELAGRSIMVFARASNPLLFDLLYTDLRAAGAQLIEDAATWSNAAVRDRLGADFLAAAASGAFGRRPRAGRVRRPVEGVPAVPFKLLYRRAGTTGSATALVRLAREFAHADSKTASGTA